MMKSPVLSTLLLSIVSLAAACAPPGNDDDDGVVATSQSAVVMSDAARGVLTVPPALQPCVDAVEKEAGRQGNQGPDLLWRGFNGALRTSGAKAQDGSPITLVAEGGWLRGYKDNIAMESGAWTGAVLNAVFSCRGSAAEIASPIQIKSVSADWLGPGVHGYDIAFYDEKTKQATPACPTGELAIAMPRVWEDNGAKTDAVDRFTLACSGSAVGKCVVWGYRPWESIPSRDAGFMEGLHQACVRMVRADYCGDGVSATEPGTLIEFIDNAGIAGGSGSLPGATIEAAWGPDGALCINHPRWPEDTPSCAYHRVSCAGRVSSLPEETPILVNRSTIHWK